MDPNGDVQLWDTDNVAPRFIKKTFGEGEEDKAMDELHKGPRWRSRDKDLRYSAGTAPVEGLDTATAKTPALESVGEPPSQKGSQKD